MDKKIPRDNFRLVTVFLCVIVAVAFTAIVYSVQVTDLENQIVSLQSPRLVNISLGYTDNNQGVINISGYVYNPGTQRAYSCHVRVDQYKDGAIANSSYLYFGNDASDTFFGAYIPEETQYYVNETVSYTGTPPANVTLTLGWIEPWQIPIP